MNSTDALQPARGVALRWLDLVRRLAVLASMAFLIGWILNALAASLERTSRPAGFGRGVIQGILMPMSLPNLAVGQDVAIYSEQNTGVRYKLGYVAGVNLCGAVFFSVVFWRLGKLRRRRIETPSVTPGAFGYHALPGAPQPPSDHP